MSTWTATCAVALVCVVVLDVGRRYLKNTKSRRSHPLPPGPPGLPFFGNVIGVNTDAPWLTHTEWSKTYGDLVYSSLFGKDIITLNSERIAKELLEDRSRNYSDRPHLNATELCGVDWNFLFMSYGNRWRSQRRFLHHTFRRDAAPRFVPMQHRKTCQLLRRLFENPDGLADHVFEYTASIMLSSLYDYDATSRQDDLVDIVAKILDILLSALRIEVAIIVDTFPAFLKLPSWLPGMSYKKEIAAAKEFANECLEKPFAVSLQRMRSGIFSSSSSVVHDAFQMNEEKDVLADETWMKALKESAATGLLAASETSNSVLMTFFLMMTVNTEAQDKAQAQIDAVVGNDRLPTIEDRPSLPYIDAILRETSRHSPTAPFSGIHAAVEDDVYEGYHIPKGAIIIPNAWAMGHDEVRFPNSHQFIPERFLNEDGSLNSDDLENIIFGFGRRICVGRHFADTSVWLVAAKFLAVFKILKPVDEHGVEIPVVPKFSNGVAIHPLPFPFRIIPRMPGMDLKQLDELIEASAP